MGLTFEFIHNGEVLAISNELQQVSNTKIIIAGEADFRNKVKNAFEELASTISGAKLLNEIFDHLDLNKREFYIYKDSESILKNTKPFVLAFDINETRFDYRNGRGDTDVKARASTTLAHELEHVRQRIVLNYQEMQEMCVDKDPTDKKLYPYVRWKEVLAVEVENLVREELGEPFRTHYNEVKIYNDSMPKYKERKNKYYMKLENGTSKATYTSDRSEGIGNQDFTYVDMYLLTDSNKRNVNLNKSGKFKVSSSVDKETLKYSKLNGVKIGSRVTTISRGL